MWPLVSDSYPYSCLCKHSLSHCLISKFKCIWLFLAVSVLLFFRWLWRGWSDKSRGYLFDLHLHHVKDHTPINWPHPHHTVCWLRYLFYIPHFKSPYCYVVSDWSFSCCGCACHHHHHHHHHHRRRGLKSTYKQSIRPNKVNNSFKILWIKKFWKVS